MEKIITAQEVKVGMVLKTWFGTHTVIKIEPYTGKYDFCINVIAFSNGTEMANERYAMYTQIINPPKLGDIVTVRTKTNISIDEFKIISIETNSFVVGSLTILQKPIQCYVFKLNDGKWENEFYRAYTKEEEKDFYNQKRS